MTVRYVYAKSPAAAAGIAAGDTLVSLDGKPIAGRIDMIRRIGALERGATAKIEVRRGQSQRKLKIALASLPELLPPSDLPPAGEVRQEGEAAAVRGEVVSLKTPEYPNEVLGYAPDTPAAALGVVVWLHGRGGFERRELLPRWKPLCDRYGLILVAPKLTNPAGWTPTDAALVDRLLTHVAAKYHVDPTRIVVCGYESGGSLAFSSAFNHRESIRAVAAVEAVPITPLPENEPLRRLAVYVASSAKSLLAAAITSAVTRLREMKFPVVVKKLGTAPRDLNAAELAELARWVDTLDRI